MWDPIYYKTHNGSVNAGRAPERRGVGEIGAPTPLPPALGWYGRVILPPAGGAGGRPNRPGGGWGVRSFRMVSQGNFAPRGRGGGQAEQAGGRVGGAQFPHGIAG